MQKINFKIFKGYIHKFNFNIVFVLFSALFFRLIIANFGTLQLDQGTFVSWGNQLVSGGFSNFYNGWSDYFPGYLYILWLLGKVNEVIPSFQTILFKLPAIFADLGTGFLIYKIISKLKNEKSGIIFSALYLFNPAIFANSALWGQVDSITSLFSLFAIYIFPSHYLLSAVSLSIGTLMKPQAAFILPAIIYLFIVHKKRFTKLLNYCFTGLFVFVLGFLPFSNTSNLFKFILERISISGNQYPYGSVNAFSFWGLFGFWKPDNITFWVGLSISLILVILATIVIFKKKIKGGEYLITGISLFITFMFLTRMHERHLLPALAPLLVASVINPILLVVYGGLSFTYIANLAYAYYWITDNFKEIFNHISINGLIIINLSILLLTIIALFKKFKIKFKINNFSNEISFKTKDISIKTSTIFIATILIFSFFFRAYKLDLPKDMYFDEIYHSFTAKLVLHNDPKAWEWWNPNPEGFAYEWTHPPISKLGMALGMSIFGENQFGWRIPQAILGTFSILLVYFLSKAIFKDNLTGILSALVFSLDGLPLVLSRMGMNDIYALFFSLLTINLFIRNKNILSAVFFGFAIASKWSAVYIFPIIFISHFVFKKKLSLSYLSYLVLPIIIYILSYFLMFNSGHSWNQFIEVQKQMWWYHTNLVAEHPYSSPAWSWPLLLRPIYLYDGQTVDGLVARIYAFGNPFIFWFGLFSIILSFFISFRERSKKLGFVLFSYLILFLPWIASPRIMFLYHYLPSLPFLAIASGFILRRFPKSIFYILVSSFLLFIYFYPHWIGLRIPVWLDNSYYWINTWR